MKINTKVINYSVSKVNKPSQLIQRPRFQALALCQSDSIHSDKWLKLERLVYESITVANLLY